MSSDKCLVFAINSEGQSKIITELSGHEGPILLASWAHPQFGSLIATAGIDGKIIFHRQTSKDWEKIYVSEFKQTITTLSFNPKPSHNVLQCAVGFADGNIQLISYNQENWVTNQIKAHSYGVTTLAWINRNNNTSRIITGGNDSSLKIWNVSIKSGIEEAQQLEKIHDNAIKQIEVMPFEENSLSISFVSLDIDDLVCIWTSAQGESFVGEGAKFNSEQKPSNINHITWSNDGLYLSISTADSTFLYKKFEDEWVLFSSLGQEGVFINHYEES